MSDALSEFIFYLQMHQVKVKGRIEIVHNFVAKIEIWVASNLRLSKCIVLQVVDYFIKIYHLVQNLLGNTVSVVRMHIGSHVDNTFLVIHGNVEFPLLWTCVVLIFWTKCTSFENEAAVCYQFWIRNHMDCFTHEDSLPPWIHTGLSSINGVSLPCK